MAYGFANTRYALAATLLLWALPLLGQLEVGESSTQMTGNVAVGYDGSYGESLASEHGISVGGEAYLHGSYYDPKFISYDFHPYYNRNQNNSAYQSISNSSGFNGSDNLLSGSHFPGFVSYTKNYSGSGTFGLPGASGLTTHGSGQTFSVGWSELLPDMPTLFASYTMTDSASTIYGSDAQSGSANKMLDLHSDYTVAGFRLGAFFQHQNASADIPAFLVGQQEVRSDTSSNSYGVTAQHRLPLHGDIYGGWHHSGYGYDYAGGHTDASSHTANVNAMMRPVSKLSLSMGMTYTNNLSAALVQEVVNAGAPPPPALSEFASHSAQYNASAGYTIFSNLYVQGQVTHWNQVVGGRDFSNTQYGATVNYNMVRNFLGNFTFVVGVMDNTNQEGHIGTSLVSNLNYSRRIDGWDVGAHFSYSQNLQTLVAIYTTSSYGYGGTVRRRLGYRTYWNASFSGGHSGLNQFEGFSSKSESFSSSLTHRGYAVSASYSNSNGVSLFTPAGVIQPPLPPPVIGPNDLILFNGRGWSFGAGGSPIRRLQLTGSFSRSLSNTLSPTLDTRTHTNMFNVQARYPVRKLYLTGGYTRFQQGLGSAGTNPTDVTTYYVGVSRWFNFF